MRKWIKVYLVAIGAFCLTLAFVKQFGGQRTKTPPPRHAEAKESSSTLAAGRESRGARLTASRQGSVSSEKPRRREPFEEVPGEVGPGAVIAESPRATAAETEKIGPDVRYPRTDTPSVSPPPSIPGGSPRGTVVPRAEYPPDERTLATVEETGRNTARRIPGRQDSDVSETPDRVRRDEPRQPQYDELHVTRHVEDRGNLSVALTVNIPAQASHIPNGVIIVEQIPPGWTVVNSSPSYDSLDASTGEVKWLLMGQEVQNRLIHYELQPRENVPGFSPSQLKGRYLYRGPRGEENAFVIIGQ